MKKVLVSVLSAFVALAFLAGCTKAPDGKGGSSSSAGLPSGYGYLNLNVSMGVSGNILPWINPNVDTAGIVSYQVTISGTGMTNIVTNSGSSVSIAIPAGKNRVVMVEGRNGGGVFIPGAKFFSYGDINAGVTTTITVNWNTTPAGGILSALLGLSVSLNDVNAAALQTLVNSSTEKKLIDFVSNANIYKTVTNFASPLVLYTPGRILGRIFASDGTTALGANLQVKARDYLSPATLSYAGAYYTNVNVVPGSNVTVQVYYGSSLIATTNAAVANGQTVVLNITTTISPDQVGTGGIIIDLGTNQLVANAGADFNAYTGYTSYLVGTNSIGAITYLWYQTGGPENMTINNATSNIANFTPAVAGTNVFSLIVGDGNDLQATNVRAFVYAVTPLAQSFINGTNGWFSFAGGAGTVFAFVGTNAGGYNNGAAVVLNGSTPSGYLIGACGTSVDTILPPYSASYNAVNLTNYSKIRMYIRNLDVANSASNKLSIALIDSQSNVMSGGDGIYANWDSHGYPPLYQGWQGDGWYEINLTWSGMVQSNSTANQFNKDPYNGVQTGTFDWTKVLKIKIVLGATGIGVGRGTFVVDELMFINK
jgi:hypothetical protein